jgi:hypothetical protein
VKPNSEFESILTDSIEKGLSVLGESPKQAIYFYLENKYNLPKEKIASKTDLFVPAIEKIFGLGAEFLKALILKTLHEKVGLTFEPGEHPEIAFMSSLEKAQAHAPICRNFPNTQSKGGEGR